MKRIPWTAACLLWASACTDPKGPEPTRSAPSSNPTPEPDRSPASLTEGSLHSHMQEHFVRVDQVKTAVVEGDLDEARRHAQWLAEHEAHSELPQGWEPFLAEMQNQAKAVMEAEEVSKMSAATAALAGTCGSCHAGLEASVRLGAPKAPEDPVKLHAWASYRLWDAVVSRSEDLWKEGSKALSKASLGDGPALKSHLKTAEAAVSRIQTAEDPSAQVQALGEYLGTCQGCHQAAAGAED